MRQLIKMIFYRISQNTIYLLMALFIPPLVAIAAIIYTNNIENNVRIAVIGNEAISIPNITAINQEEKPMLSELVQGKYDAIVWKEDEYKIETLKGEEFEIAFDRVLNQGETVEEAFKSKEQRGVISILMGFLTMLILLLGSMLYKFYYQERSGTDKRIVVSKVGYLKYTLSHPAVVFLILFVPTATILLLANSILSLSQTVTNMQLLLMIFTLCLLSASFSFCVASMFKTEQNGSLTSTMVIIITSLVSGSFIEISKAGLARQISYLFPQRYIIDFAINLENENAAGYVSIAVIIAISIIMLILRWNF